jgi:hypothetical protein
MRDVFNSVVLALVCKLQGIDLGWLPGHLSSLFSKIGAFVSIALEMEVMITMLEILKSQHIFVDLLRFF